MRQLIAGLPIRMLAPEDCRVLEVPDETGGSYLENATLKARFYSLHSGLLAVADDSGLSVDALLGGPGLYSSRFGGEDATDGERNQLLLRCLKGVPAQKRGARFTCAVVVALGVEVLFSAVETVEGHIVEEPRGSNGFGYDPLFFFPPFGQTFGEVSPEAKGEVSHRGKAFARLKVFLTDFARQSQGPSGARDHP